MHHKQRTLTFPGPMHPETIHIETVSRDGTGIQYHGPMRLKLVNDANIMHTYEVPNAINDPHTNFNILGVTFLGDFFGDQHPGQDAVLRLMERSLPPALANLTLFGITASMSATSTILT
jgi:hypothetical protein